MDDATAHKLIALTNDFYEHNAVSFSDTRQRPWQGWYRMLEAVGFNDSIAKCASDGKLYRVCDVGCGNMRFEAMLEDVVRGKAPLSNPVIEALCVDKSESLLTHSEPSMKHFPTIRIETMNTDIACALRDQGSLARLCGNNSFDLVVCFALMHHIPLLYQRKELLASLLDMAAPGAYIAVSFWQFSKDERIFMKAMRTTEKACNSLGLELDVNSGDFLLGWQDVDGFYRYCHDFSDADINDVVQGCLQTREDASLVCEFTSDGKSDDLNKYVVLQKDRGC